MHEEENVQSNNSISEEAFHQSNLAMIGARVLRGMGMIVTGPVEMAIRPHFGSQYIPIPLAIVILGFLQLAGIGSFILNRMGMTWLHSSAPVGMWAVSLLFYLGCIWHGKRIWHLMKNPELENHSESEGDALAFYSKLPNGNRWTRVRAIYEPLTVALAAVVLFVCGLIQTLVAIYLLACAGFLYFNACFSWYEGWVRIRRHLDAKAEMGILTGIIRGEEPVPQTIGRRPVGEWIPKGASRQKQAAMAADVLYQKDLPKELKDMLSPLKPEGPDAPAAA